MRSKPAPLAFPELLEYAIRCVTGRAMSIGELRQRLVRRAAECDDIDRVIQHLKNAGALDDRVFAESYAAYRLQNQGFGKMRVLRDLRARRVAPQVAEQAEMELIEHYLERKFRGKNLAVFLAEEKNLASVFRKLRTAGFSAGNSIRALKKHSQKADELEGMESEAEEEDRG
jgi:regulatory protein